MNDTAAVRARFRRIKVVSYAMLGVATAAVVGALAAFFA